MSRSIIYIGGGKILSEKMSATVKEILKITKNKKLKSLLIVLVGTSKIKTWVNISKELFSKTIEFSYDLYDVDKENISTTQKKLEEADIVFFTGGNPLNWLNSLNKKSLKEKFRKELLNNSQLIFGISAGALVLNEQTLITEDEEFDKTVLIDGLGIENSFMCEVHYEKSKFELIEPFSKQNNLICLPDNSSYLIQENGVRKEIGLVYKYPKHI